MQEELQTQEQIGEALSKEELKILLGNRKLELMALNLDRERAKMVIQETDFLEKGLVEDIIQISETLSNLDNV